jgi:hypothetical protein
MKPRVPFIFLFTLWIVFLTGCTTVTKEEVATSDYGPYPSAYESEIKGKMGGTLKDPYSAIYRFGTPQKGFAQDGFARGGKKHFGWIVPFWVNAKNGYGGYTGEKLYYFMFADGRSAEITGMINTGMARTIEP